MPSSCVLCNSRSLDFRNPLPIHSSEFGRTIINQLPQSHRKPLRMRLRESRRGDQFRIDWPEQRRQWLAWTGAFRSLGSITSARQAYLWQTRIDRQGSGCASRRYGTFVLHWDTPSLQCHCVKQRKRVSQPRAVKLPRTSHPRGRSGGDLAGKELGSSWQLQSIDGL